jgi:HAD superfamily hydrolase (TIGR01549 family)
MIKAVIFDLWSTLAYSDSDVSVIKRMFDRIGVKDDVENHHKMDESFMKKSESVMDAMRHFCRAFGKDDSCAGELASYWKDVRPKLFDDVTGTLEALRRDYKIGLITNTQSFSMDFFRKTKFFRMFDYACLSYEVGMVKPEPGIFQLTLKRLGVKPEEAVMVGDSLNSDILPAEALGIRGVLIKRLHKEGLGWKERQKWKRTINSLTELDRFL